MIEKILTRMEITGEFSTTRMTRATSGEHLVFAEVRDGRVGLVSARMFLLPANMPGHRPMTSLTAHSRFSHTRLITIGRLQIVLAHARIVASGAHNIPSHTPATPMAPLTRLTILLAEDVKPLAMCGIDRQFRRLE